MPPRCALALCQLVTIICAKLNKLHASIKTIMTNEWYIIILLIKLQLKQYKRGSSDYFSANLEEILANFVEWGLQSLPKMGWKGVCCISVWRKPELPLRKPCPWYHQSTSCEWKIIENTKCRHKEVHMSVTSPLVSPKPLKEVPIIISIYNCI